MTLRVLFVTDRHDAPYRYRCVHGASQLRAAGAVANVLRLDVPGADTSLDGYTVIVLFRLPWGPAVERLVERARRAGLPLVFDCDDLVFDPAAAPLLSFRHAYTPAVWARRHGAEIAALRRTFDACDAFIGSTPALAEWADRLGKPGHVHPNVVPDEYSRRAAWLRPLGARLRNGSTIGYFSGSNTHDLDFVRAAPALRAVLGRSPNTRLLLAGFLDVGETLAGLEHRIVRLPYLGFRTLPWAYAACDVTIAPISELNAFTNGKSALKFFEPGAFGVPVIASPIASMKDAVCDGISGWLCETQAEWERALETALDPRINRAVGEAARQAVAQNHSSASVRGQLARLLGEIAIPPAGKAPRQTKLVQDEHHGHSDSLSRALAPVRRVGEILRVADAMREPIDHGLPAPEAEALANQIADGHEPPGVAILIAGSPEASGWTPASAEPTITLLGETRFGNADPHYVSPPVELGSRSYRYAVIHMRASSESSRGVAQLFWQSTRWRSFNEEQSARIPIATDGTDATYVCDLWKTRDSARWRRGAFPVGFRIDPLHRDLAGSARILGLYLVPDGWTSVRTPARSGDRVLRLEADAHAARRALETVLFDLPIGETVWVESLRAPLVARRWLARRLVGSGCVVERIERAEPLVRFLVRRNREARPPGVDVVVPVFNAREQTLRCLRSVLRHGEGDFRLVVVDDASTDPELWPALALLAENEPRVVLLRNSENVGFVQSANRGFAGANGRDVLLLNSDTRVFRHFLERLRACTYEDERTGIVCPLSNNATICSVPEFCRPNPLPPTMSGSQMAKLVASSSRRRFPDLVTPVGFCMYVRSSVLSQIGDFDAAFGRGYGEENDFGERAKAAGWRIRLADDVFVWHDGKASFSEEGYALENSNSRVLEERHPGYHSRVAHFIEQNPLAPIHADLRWHLERWRYRSESAVMMLLHASPLLESCGGTEYIVRDLVAELRLPRVVVAYPGVSSIEVIEVHDGDWGNASLHRFPLTEEVPRVCHEHPEATHLFQELLQLFRIRHVHIHHLLGWPVSIGRTLTSARIPYSVTVHDFYSVCPSQNLLNLRTHQRCCPKVSRDPECARACLGELFAHGVQPEPLATFELLCRHRALFGQLFANAARIFFPSPSARSLVGEVYALAETRSVVLPHAYLPRSDRPAREDRNGRTLRVGLLGEISYAAKGAEGYLEVLGKLRDAPIEWHLFGETNRFDFERRLTALGSDARIVRHGPYARAEIVEQLQRAQVDVGLLLPIWPETFSLTLSELLGARIPVVAARQGALADRLVGERHGILVDSHREAAEKLAELASDPRLVAAMSRDIDRVPAPDVGAWSALQRAVYQDHSASVDRAPLGAKDYQELAQTRVTEVRATRRLVSMSEPAARHRSARWYQRAERMKPYLPESVRALARGFLSDDRFRTLQRFRIPGRRALPNSEVRIEARYLNTTRCSSVGTDPSFFIQITPIAPEAVKALRFDVWCSHHGYTYAQVYWRHEDDSGFAEERSVKVELVGNLGDWQAYVVRVDPETHPSFFGRKKLVALRFDPVNYAGLFCVGTLSLCADED